MEQFSIFVSSQGLEMSSENFADFTETTHNYLKCIESILDESACLRAIVRMWGVLPLNKKFLPIRKHEVYSSVVNLLQYVLPNLPILFDEINEIEWLLFKDGLEILIFIETLCGNINAKYDSITEFLQFAAKLNQKQEIMHSLLQRLLQSQQPIQRPNWINLLSFMSYDKLICSDYLRLSSSFDAFFLCSTYILKSSQHNKDLQTNVKHIFNEMITQRVLRSKYIDHLLIIIILSVFCNLI